MTFKLLDVPGVQEIGELLVHSIFQEVRSGGRHASDAGDSWVVDLFQVGVIDAGDAETREELHLDLVVDISCCLLQL